MPILPPSIMEGMEECTPSRESDEPNRTHMDGCVRRKGAGGG